MNTSKILTLDLIIFLVVCQMDMYTRWKKKAKLSEERTKEEVFKVYLLVKESIRDLY